MKPSLFPGDPAPLFRTEDSAGKRLTLADLAGKRILLCFFATLSAADGFGRRLLEEWRTLHALLARQDCLLIGIGYEPKDGADPLLTDLPDTIRIVWDRNGEIARQYGVADSDPSGQIRHLFTHVLLDIDLTILSVLPATKEGQPIDSAIKMIEALPPLPAYHALPSRHAPVLILPHVFEEGLCRTLIDGYRRHGGTPSGFMQERDGKSVIATDPTHKVRSDWIVEDQKLQEAVRARIQRRIVPAIAKAFQFQVTRIERYIVACYDAEAGGHFRAHRDNTTKGTAHRRFAVTINLNANEYEGGDLTFPEYGRATYRAPTGGAVVFSCSLLHQALAVTKGQRFCFLPFLYDEEAAKIRAENNQYLGEGVGRYRA